ncbi:RNA annealing protein YRA1 [Wickerhamiella sorbophila]|uniref:RNA annealing protein YRA1 n=1 Tax=Wickerhamiella sorbophila TaxID=45607 RepID=A0A2T0FJC9_9ASCO|nr:RNA annealing protein YRA1 [Wickerhamiella sorbophila]PRT55113.1 RNA annealing protein YRA1 [Wickerhamiella sorbophila]
MNATVDKSLDEIISTNGSNKKSVRRKQAGIRKSALSRKKATVKGGASPKAAKVAAAAAKNGSGKKVAASAAAAAAQDLTQYATRIIISNMPKDVNESQVEKFFKSELGHVSKVVASYNARGVRTGQFTITFTKDGLAAKAMERFNGTVIDNGAAKMKVEIVFDQSAKPLAQRLSLKPAADSAKPATDGQRSQKKRLRVKQKNAAAAATGVANSTSDKKADAKPKNDRRRSKGRRTKTTEELDAEMADYFAGGEPAADIIS